MCLENRPEFQPGIIGHAVGQVEQPGGCIKTGDKEGNYWHVLKTSHMVQWL
jgi:hypothetical protein